MNPSHDGVPVGVGVAVAVGVITGVADGAVEGAADGGKEAAAQFHTVTRTAALCRGLSEEGRSAGSMHPGLLGSLLGGGGGLWTRPVDRGAWTAKTVKRPPQQPAHPQYANYWAPLTRKRHTMPHSAQPQHTNYWALRTRKRHQQEHRPQRPTESSDPTQHAKGRTGDRPGPRKETTTRRNVTWGGSGGGARRSASREVWCVAWLSVGGWRSAGVGCRVQAYRTQALICSGRQP